VAATAAWAAAAAAGLRTRTVRVNERDPITLSLPGDAASETRTNLLVSYS
jgi:hypothetical protein